MKVVYFIKALFKCNICGVTVEETNVHGVHKPSMCINDSCKSINCMALVHNRCQYINKQTYKIQEITG